MTDQLPVFMTQYNSLSVRLCLSVCLFLSLSLSLSLSVCDTKTDMHGSCLVDVLFHGKRSYASIGEFAENKRVIQEFQENDNCDDGGNVV